MAKEPPYRIKNMMPGMIMLWAGAIVDIPTGWALCDGTLGTPDLGDKFVLAGGGMFPIDFTAGAQNHTHDYTGDGHAHNLFPGDKIINSDPAGDFEAVTTQQAGAGTTDLKDHMPPFHVLAYIMKL